MTVILGSESNTDAPDTVNFTIGELAAMVRAIRSAAGPTAAITAAGALDALLEAKMKAALYGQGVAA